jgi:hypothetical protein
MSQRAADFPAQRLCLWPERRVPATPRPKPRLALWSYSASVPAALTFLRTSTFNGGVLFNERLEPRPRFWDVSFIQAPLASSPSGYCLAKTPSASPLSRSRRSKALDNHIARYPDPALIPLARLRALGRATCVQRSRRKRGQRRLVQETVCPQVCRRRRLEGKPREQCNILRVTSAPIHCDRIRRDLAR